MPKRSPDTLENCIFYDNTQMYFPTDIMDCICTSSGIKNYKKLLVKLRSKGLLSAAQDRLSKQIVVNQKNFTCYVLRRELFEKTGDIDITLIGKETKLC